jgi:hypothetical protein
MKISVSLRSMVEPPTWCLTPSRYAYGRWRAIGEVRHNEYPCDLGHGHPAEPIRRPFAPFSPSLVESYRSQDSSFGARCSRISSPLRSNPSILLPVWKGLELNGRGVAVWSSEDGHEATQWKPEQKALIVLEWLKGRPIGDLCAEHEISQAQCYQWRDPFLANAARAFEPAGAPQRQGCSNAKTRGSRA